MRYPICAALALEYARAAMNWQQRQEQALLCCYCHNATQRLYDFMIAMVTIKWQASKDQN
jgi:hypothetical protein